MQRFFGFEDTEPKGFYRVKEWAVLGLDDPDPLWAAKAVAQAAGRWDPKTMPHDDTRPKRNW